MNTLNLLAQNPDVGDSNPNYVTNPLFGNSLQSFVASDDPSGFLNLFLPKLIGFVFVFGAVAFFFIFIWGAVTWILSGGDKAGVESAKSKITNTIIGFVLLISSFAVVKLIETFFGINILSIDIGLLVIQ